MTTVEFVRRPPWGGFGDLRIDGEDQGWTPPEEAKQVTADHGVELVVLEESDANVKHPREK